MKLCVIKSHRDFYSLKYEVFYLQIGIYSNKKYYFSNK